MPRVSKERHLVKRQQSDQFDIERHETRVSTASSKAQSANRFSFSSRRTSLIQKESSNEFEISQTAEEVETPLFTQAKDFEVRPRLLLDF